MTVTQSRRRISWELRWLGNRILNVFNLNYFIFKLFYWHDSQIYFKCMWPGAVLLDSAGWDTWLDLGRNTSYLMFWTYITSLSFLASLSPTLPPPYCEIIEALSSYFESFDIIWLVFDTRNCPKFTLSRPQPWNSLALYWAENVCGNRDQGAKFSHCSCVNVSRLFSRRNRGREICTYFLVHINCSPI